MRTCHTRVEEDPKTYWRTQCLASRHRRGTTPRQVEGEGPLATFGVDSDPSCFIWTQDGEVSALMYSQAQMRMSSSAGESY
jgi:hypothetical protein